MANIKIPKKPDDFFIQKPEWRNGTSERYKAFRNVICNSNGAIPACAGLQCTFYRKGECWAEDYGAKCTWPYYWKKVDDDGNVLDRDGHILYTKEEVEKYKL